MSDTNDDQSTEDQGVVDSPLEVETEVVQEPENTPDPEPAEGATFEPVPTDGQPPHDEAQSEVE